MIEKRTITFDEMLLSYDDVGRGFLNITKGKVKEVKVLNDCLVDPLAG